jgi:hypothetical protein
MSMCLFLNPVALWVRLVFLDDMRLCVHTGFSLKGVYPRVWNN